MIESKRVKIYPANKEQMENQIASENNPEVKAVEAETDFTNTASQKVLEKCGFKATGTMGEEGPRYILYREEV